MKFAAKLPYFRNYVFSFVSITAVSRNGVLRSSPAVLRWKEICFHFRSCGQVLSAIHRLLEKT